MRKPLFRELTATLLLVVLYRACSQVSLPFINQQALTIFFDSSYVVCGPKLEHISILCLGIMPYMTGYVLVEIASLVVPFLKRLRHGDSKGRSKLKRFALCVTLIITVWQATGLINSLSDITTTDGSHILHIENASAYGFLLLSMVGGVFFLIIISELISLYGIGNGISIIILVGICAGLTLIPADLSRLFNEVALFPLFVLFPIVCMAILSTIILVTTKVNTSLKHRTSDHLVSSFQLTLCPSGVVAISFATSVIMLPATVAYFLGGEDLSASLEPGTLSYNSLLVFFIFVFSYLFAWLFFHPTRRLDKIRERGWDFLQNRQLTYDYLTRRLLIYNLPWTLLLCGLAIIPHILIVSANVPFYIGGSRLIIALVISIDIVARFGTLHRLKWGRLIKIAELHDVYDASMIKEHLKSEGIIFHLQGYYHRHLLYFFGPYIDISLMVEEKEVETAENILRSYYGGLGLVRPYAIDTAV